MLHKPRYRQIVECVANITESTLTSAVLLVSGCNNTKSYDAQLLKVLMIHTNAPSV